MNFTKPLSLLILLLSLSTFAQTPEPEGDKLSLNSGTLDNQFEYIITKSNGWKDQRGQTYKVIKTNWLSDLKSHILDSIKAARKDLIATEITVKAQTQEIADLKNNLAISQESLTNSQNEKDSMQLLGASISKTGYSAIMWGVVAVLLVLLLFFIYKFKNSNLVTKKAKHNLSELEEEFEEHRKTAVEREQKVRRQLQDEINKQKIIKNKN